jgi:hypothetical protein
VAIAIYQLTYFLRKQLLSFVDFDHQTNVLSLCRFNAALAGVLILIAVIDARAQSADDGQPRSSNAQNLAVNLEFRVADLELSQSLKFGGIRAQCDSWVLTYDTLSCRRATLEIANSPIGGLSLNAEIDWSPYRGQWRIAGVSELVGDSRIHFKIAQSEGQKQLQVSLSNVDLAVLVKLMDGDTSLLGDHSLDSGRLSADINCRQVGEVIEHCRATGRVDGLNVNGVNVAEDVRMTFGGDYSLHDTGEVLEMNLALLDGAVYIEPGFQLGAVNPGFFIASNDTPIDVRATVARLSDGDIRVRRATLEHSNVVSLTFVGDLGFSPAPGWRSLDFNLQTQNVSEFYQTYMQPIALDTAFSSLETSGALRLEITGVENEVDRFSVQFDQVYIDDDDGRFSLYGLDGDIELHAAENLRESQIEWIGAAIYDVQVGPGRIEWTSAGRGLRVSGWRDVAIFDGEFRMDSLEIEQFGIADTKLAMSGTLTPITLSALTAAFGTIPLYGKLSGTIPRLSYSGNRLAMDGTLRINVFDGQILLHDLEIDKMFSTVPVLSANMSVENLDLEELTSTFSFGKITGRIAGQIDDLVLQAWRPTQFDASFATPIDDDVKHRISQQAVDNLGRLGAGTGTGLSQGWLGLIPSYSYGRLGIGCKLVSEHCLMRGVEQDSDGSFYILTRGGILPPWIDVKGSGRRIKWQTLVDGIKQISEGEFELDIGVTSGNDIQ